MKFAVFVSIKITWNKFARKRFAWHDQGNHILIPFFLFSEYSYIHEQTKGPKFQRGQLKNKLSYLQQARTKTALRELLKRPNSPYILISSCFVWGINRSVFLKCFHLKKVFSSEIERKTISYGKSRCACNYFSLCFFSVLTVTNLPCRVCFMKIASPDFTNSISKKILQHAKSLSSLPRWCGLKNT